MLRGVIQRASIFTEYGKGAHQSLEDDWATPRHRYIPITVLSDQRRDVLTEFFCMFLKKPALNINV